MELDWKKLDDLFGIDSDVPVDFDLNNIDEGAYAPVCIGWNRGLVGSMTGIGTKPCAYKGLDFTSMTEAAEHFGVTISAVSLYVSRKGCRRYEMPVMYKGKTYKSIADAAKCNDAPYSSVANWVRRHNSYIQDGN